LILTLDYECHCEPFDRRMKQSLLYIVLDVRPLLDTKHEIASPTARNDKNKYMKGIMWL